MFSIQEFKQKMLELHKINAVLAGEADEISSALLRVTYFEHVAKYKAKNEEVHKSIGENNEEIKRLFSEAVEGANTSDELDEIAIATAEVKGEEDVCRQRDYFATIENLMESIRKRKVMIEKSTEPKEKEERLSSFKKKFLTLNRRLVEEEKSFENTLTRDHAINNLTKDYFQQAVSEARTPEELLEIGRIVLEVRDEVIGDDRERGMRFIELRNFTETLRRKERELKEGLEGMVEVRKGRV